MDYGTLNIKYYSRLYGPAAGAAAASAKSLMTEQGKYLTLLR